MSWHNTNKARAGCGDFCSGSGDCWDNPSDRLSESLRSSATQSGPSFDCKTPASLDYATTGGSTVSAREGSSLFSFWTKPSSVKTWQPDAEELAEAIASSLSSQPWQIDSPSRWRRKTWFWQLTTGLQVGSILEPALTARVERIKAPLLAGCMCWLWICKGLLGSLPAIATPDELPGPAPLQWAIETPKRR
jgi:hypothetical protein